MKGRLTDRAVLRRLLVERELTIRRLAVDAGLSYSLVRKVLAGERQLSDLTAHKVARVLGCPVETFSHHPAEEAAA